MVVVENSDSSPSSTSRGSPAMTRRKLLNSARSSASDAPEAPLQIGRLQVPAPSAEEKRKSSSRSSKRRSFIFPSMAATHLHSMATVFSHLSTPDLLAAMRVCKQWHAASDLPAAHNSQTRRVLIDLNQNPMGLDQMANSSWGYRIKDCSITADSTETNNCDRAISQLYQVIDLKALRLDLFLDTSVSTLRSCFSSMGASLQVLEICQKQVESFELYLPLLTELVKLSYVALEEVSVLEQLPKLEELHLTQTPCSPELMLAVRKASVNGQLKQLYFHAETDHCDGMQKLTSNEPNLSAAALDTLILSGNGPSELTAKTLLAVLAMPNLIHLRCHLDLKLWMRQVNPLTLRTLARLQELDVAYSSEAGMGYAELSPLLYCGQLRTLRINATWEGSFEAASMLPPLCRACPKIEELELSGLHASNAADWNRLVALQHLHSFTLDSGSENEDILPDELVTSLAKLPNFTTLRVSQLPITFSLSPKMIEVISSSETWSSIHVRTSGNGTPGNCWSPNYFIAEQRREVLEMPQVERRMNCFRLYHAYMPKTASLPLAKLQETSYPITYRKL